MLEDLYLSCPQCAQVCLVEIPPCPDGHGADCPDRACVECGTALWIGGAVSEPSKRAVARHAA